MTIHLTAFNSVRVSVCMATYNGMPFIRNQIQSILQQLHMNDELIVVDDSSNDSTFEFLSSLHDNRIKLFKNDSNLGFIKTFERALSFCTNEIIILSDQDDIWMPYKVDLIKHLFFFNPKICSIVSNHSLIDESDQLLSSSYFRYTWIPRMPILRTYAHGPGLSFRRKYLSKILPFPRRIKSHDQWIGQLLSVLSIDILFIKFPLESYRRHSSQFTHNIKSSVPFRLKLLNRVNMIKSICFRVLGIG